MPEFPRKDYWIEIRFTHGDQGMSYLVHGDDPMSRAAWRPSPNTVKVVQVRSCMGSTDAVARAIAGLPVVETVWDVKTERRARL